MNIVRMIFALFVGLLMVVSSAVAHEEIVVDGYRFANKVQPEFMGKTILLAPGEKLRVGKKCLEEKEKRSAFHYTQVCTWEKTVVGTMTNAPQVIEGGSGSTEGFRDDTTLILSSIALMIIALVLYRVRGRHSGITLPCIAISMILSVLYGALVWPLSFYPALVGLGIIISCVSIIFSLDRDVHLFRSSGVYIALMTILFFMIV